MVPGAVGRRAPVVAVQAAPEHERSLHVVECLQVLALPPHPPRVRRLAEKCIHSLPHPSSPPDARRHSHPFAASVTCNPPICRPETCSLLTGTNRTSACSRAHSSSTRSSTKSSTCVDIVRTPSPRACPLSCGDSLLSRELSGVLVGIVWQRAILLSFFRYRRRSSMQCLSG
jgi:hypothetical protein